MDRLTGIDEEGTHLKLQGCAKGEKQYYTDDREFMNAFYAKQVIDKLCKLEDILEKYGIGNIENLDMALGAERWRLEDRQELKQAKTDRDTWKKACELACRGSLDVVRCDTCFHKPETCEGDGEDETCVNGVMTYFYAQAQKEMKSK